MNPSPVPCPEHPRPDFMRDTFYNLNGPWAFAFDDRNAGLAEKWYRPDITFDRTILVPFPYQCEMSGIGPTDEIHSVVWYRRRFCVPADMKGRRVLLRFGAVDFRTRVYVNGQLAGSHTGGYTPFALDVTDLLIDGENDLCVRAEDWPDCTQPRGKQYWKQGLMGCWYTPVTGIWQTVYLEAAGDCRISHIHITPDVDRDEMTAEIALNRFPGAGTEIEMTVSLEGRLVRRVIATAGDRTVRIPVHMAAQGAHESVALWHPDHPSLYDVRVRVLTDGEMQDDVRTYFGMRKIEVVDGRVYLNNERLYQRLVLDQGYWPQSLLTPPDDEAIQADIAWTKKLGYNGARKHQKIEDPRYYYWADKMGLLVWGEVPSAYDFTDESVRSLADTLAGFIERDFNHPSIITWVPLNESWGVPRIYANARQQSAARMLCQMTKALDGTRLCSVNDGWEQVGGDFCALHDYADKGEILAGHFADRAQLEKSTNDMRHCFAQGETPTGQEALMVTEYGGIAFSNQGQQGSMGGMSTWGYHDKVDNEEAFFERFAALTGVIWAIPGCQGFCYTQLTDVMQEVNGLLTPDRKPKMDVDRLARINRNESV